MKTFTGILLIILNLINSHQKAFPQNNYNYKSEHISPEEGVSNNLIFCITLDSKGFIWFRTMFGLV